MFCTPTIPPWSQVCAAAALILLVGCGAPAQERAAAPEANGDTIPDAEASSVPLLPSFEDYPATEEFSGEPVAVDFDSYPEAKSFQTALTRDAQAGAKNARFAGHYRIVVIGCGTSCKSVWAIDLVDGSVHNVFTASYDVAFRPDSRLIVENGPDAYEKLLEEMPAAEVERIMETYGAPRFWVEDEGEFRRIGPYDLRLDAGTGKVVAVSEPAAASWRCTNDLEVRCGDGACTAESEGAFTPMSVAVEASGELSVCAYSGCWEGTGEVSGGSRFLVLAGRDLGFSTSADPEARADVLVAIDRTDGVGTLKVGEFALPLLCEPVEPAG